MITIALLPDAFSSLMPLLKKPGLDSSLPENYRPISNFQFEYHLKNPGKTGINSTATTSVEFIKFQRVSGYRSGHSTETALLEVLDDVYTAAGE